MGHAPATSAELAFLVAHRRFRRLSVADGVATVAWETRTVGEATIRGPLGLAVRLVVAQLRLYDAACDHDALIRDRAAFEAASTFRGWQEDPGEAPLELRNCRRCNSTISDGTRAPMEMSA